MLVSSDPNRPLIHAPKGPAAPLPALDAVVAIDKEHLLDLIRTAINRQGIRCSLNHINVSGIRDMSNVFEGSLFNGDISLWDTSNVESMHSMFKTSNFQGNIAGWNVPRVKTTAFMFAYSVFNGDISGWKFERLETTGSMFMNAAFNSRIADWNVSNVKDMSNMFIGSQFRGDLSRWRISEFTTTHFFMDVDTLLKLSAPNQFYWQAILGTKLIQKKGHPWSIHFAETYQLMELMDIKTPSAMALFLQQAWIGKHSPEMMTSETFTLPELE